MNKKDAVYSIIKMVGIAGMVGTVIIAPNSAQVFAMLAKQNKKKHTKDYPEYLRRSGYFELKNVAPDTFVVTLSTKGNKAYSGMYFEDFIQPTRKWDGRWHLLMFDIPETHKNTRRYIQRNLQNIGLRSLQDSVYVYPYDLSELANAIREEYPKVAKLIISATVTKIDGESQLRKAFESVI